jgi:phosphoribosylamine---glycine ligase
MKFVICTKDFSGLGFALVLQDEGHEVLIAYENDELEPEKEEAYELVGEGLVERSPMADVFAACSQFKEAYWIFDSNYLWQYGDKLRAQGFKVWGASELTSKMEHDRDFGIEVAKNAGIDIPPFKTFTDVQDAITFLEQNEDTAYVCKPNDVESHLTYVPQSETPEAANRELRAYLLSMDDGEEFLLQQKIRGVELNLECFFFQGKPYFAWIDLECKRKNSGDKGELTGCSQNISFIVDMNAPIVGQTIGKMFPFYQKQKYTGFGDINVILTDNQVYFIEWTCRFGYNAHPTLFRTLLLNGLGELFSKMIEGGGAFTSVAYSWFRKGFGAAILMYLDHPKIGYPLHVLKEVKDRFYHYEAYQALMAQDQEQDFSLAGYSNEVGIVFGFGFTMDDAGRSALDNALKINYPLCAYREDVNERNFPSSPIKRYEALSAMSLLK